MPPAEDIQAYLRGSWRLMTGRPDGMRAFDLSADGFWNSFFAILVALPVMFVGWVPLANELAFPGGGLAERIGIVIRLAMVDFGAWVLPIVLLALVSRSASIRDRFVHYVVITNWGSALLAWFMLPPNMIRLFWPESVETVTALGFGLFLASMVLLWRLTNVALNKGPAVASGVFGGMLVASFLVLFLLQALLGLGIS